MSPFEVFNRRGRRPRGRASCLFCRRAFTVNYDGTLRYHYDAQGLVCYGSRHRRRIR